MLLTQIKLTTRGKLVSTTDMKRAGSLNKSVTVQQIVGAYPAHYEQVDNNTILVFARRELYEIKI